MDWNWQNGLSSPTPNYMNNNKKKYKEYQKEITQLQCKHAFQQDVWNKT
jgi:hypothetical protein